MRTGSSAPRSAASSTGAPPERQAADVDGSGRPFAAIRGRGCRRRRRCRRARRRARRRGGRLRTGADRLARCRRRRRPAGPVGRLACRYRCRRRRDPRPCRHRARRRPHRDPAARPRPGRRRRPRRALAAHRRAQGGPGATATRRFPGGARRWLRVSVRPRAPVGGRVRAGRAGGLAGRPSGGGTPGRRRRSPRALRGGRCIADRSRRSITRPTWSGAGSSDWRWWRRWRPSPRSSTAIPTAPGPTAEPAAGGADRRYSTRSTR